MRKCHGRGQTGRESPPAGEVTGGTQQDPDEGECRGRFCRRSVRKMNVVCSLIELWLSAGSRHCVGRWGRARTERCGLPRPWENRCSLVPRLQAASCALPSARPVRVEHVPACSRSPGAQEQELLCWGALSGNHTAGSLAVGD